jgi:hypothetical protein
VFYHERPNDSDCDPERMAFVDGYDQATELAHYRDDDRFVATVGWDDGLSLGVAHLEEDREKAVIACVYIPERSDDDTRVFLADDERYGFAIELRRLPNDGGEA